MSNPKPPSSKILIQIPFWQGDRTQAFKLARLLADLQPGLCDLADILFTARFDARHGEETIKYVSRKFKVWKHTSKRRQTGWPLGCNGLLFGGLEFFYHKKTAGQIPNYRAILNIESDCVPLTRDWLSRIIMEWDANCISRKTHIYVAGALIPGDAERRAHINGGACLLSGDPKFMKWLVLTASSFQVSAGWDWVLAHEFKRWGWTDIHGLQSWWQTKTFNPRDWDPVVKSGVFFIHGVKDDSLLDLARKKLLG